MDSAICQQHSGKNTKPCSGATWISNDAPDVFPEIATRAPLFNPPDTASYLQSMESPWHGRVSIVNRSNGLMADGEHYQPRASQDRCEAIHTISGLIVYGEIWADSDRRVSAINAAGLRCFLTSAFPDMSAVSHILSLFAGRGIDRSRHKAVLASVLTPYLATTDHCLERALLGKAIGANLSTSKGLGRLFSMGHDQQSKESHLQKRLEQ